MIRSISSVLVLVAALVALSTTAPLAPSENDISTLCPDMFSYESRDKPGQWSGRLVLRSEDDLRGIWVRLVFDKDVRLEVEGDFEVKQDQQKKEALIKSKHILLKAHQGLPVKITVKYDGDEAPNLIEYRLNARTLCPESSGIPSDFYLGDFNASDFLSKIQSTKAPQFDPNNVRCGVISSNSYPWHASLFINERFVCEAILINDLHILTPAHCVSTKDGDKPVSRKFVSVYLGDNGASKDAFQAKVAHIYVHPAYDGTSLSYDLAVLKLNEKVPVSDSLMPICLQDTQREGDLIAGYDINDQNGSGPGKTTKVRKISDEECSKTAGNLAIAVTDDSFCVAYTEKHSNCVGNSGSSFVSLENDKVYLKGFVSVGVKLQNKNQCDENTVAVVTDTTRYSKWIRTVLEY